VIDRGAFKDYLHKGQISAKLQNSESVARWLGKKFNATVVLVGQASVVRDDVVELSARFLNVSDVDLIGPSAEVNLQIETSTADFSPLTGLPSPPPPSPLPDTIDGEKVYRAGIDGVGVPNCSYKPNPEMTEASQSANFSGTVLVDGAVSRNGRVTPIRITQGAPFGLNEEVLRTLATWECKPAELNGKPVTAIVSFEMNFRP
jgi:TonB family protein